MGVFPEESRVFLKLVFALSLAVLPSGAQGWRAPTLIIDLENPGRVHAWLALTMPAPEPMAEAFRKAMGCPSTAPATRTPGSRSVEVDCPASLRKDGLRWSAHWDLTALNVELRRAGVRSMAIDIHHARCGFSKVLPAALVQFQGAGFTTSYHGQIGLSDFHDITLEAGYLPRQIGHLAAVAGVILLLPLLLFAFRAAGPLAALAGANALACLGATAWLEVALPLNVAELAPAPWNFAIASAPLLAAVWIGSRIAGGEHRRAFLWRGVRAVGFVNLLPGFFSAGLSILPWAGCSLALILGCFWGLHRGGGHRLQPAAEGELLARVRQLAARAGSHVRSVQLLLGGANLPAAFATRFGGILLTGSLLGELSRREVDAIVSHELSHVSRPRMGARGVLFLLPVATVVGFLAPASLEWMPLLLLPAFLLDRAMRRRNERLADADAVAWSGDAEALITGLVRVTRAHKMPIDWPRWVRLLMPHPSTMERVRAAAAQARITDNRLQQLLADPAGPPTDCYPVTGSSAPAGAVFGPAERARLNARLVLVGAVTPVVFGIAAPFMGYLAALLTGAASVCLVSEWVLWRARSRARARLGGRPGVFVGFSPSAGTRVYNGSYDYDWGFAAFEGDCLVFRGDRCTWSVTRQEIAEIRLADGPAGWLPRPLVAFQTRSGSAFWVRPFDGAFGSAAPRAAARLLEQARRWHGAPEAGTASRGNFDFAGVTGETPPQFTWAMLLRCLPLYGGIALAIYWMILALAPASERSDGWPLLGPVAITWGLLWFVAYPSLRHGRRRRAARSRPLAPAHSPER